MFFVGRRCRVREVEPVLDSLGDLLCRDLVREKWGEVLGLVVEPRRVPGGVLRPTPGLRPTSRERGLGTGGRPASPGLAQLRGHGTFGQQRTSTVLLRDRSW